MRLNAVFLITQLLFLVPLSLAFQAPPSSPKEPSFRDDFFNRRNFIRALGGGIVSIPLALEGYARSGSLQTDVDLFDLSKLSRRNIQDITIIFHGAGGQDDNTEKLLQVLQNKNESNHFVKIVDWSIDSADILKASIKGTKLGAKVGQQLVSFMKNSNDDVPRNVHIIGISVGAFPSHQVIQEINESLDKVRRNQINLQLTLLDPFQQKAVLDIGFGKNNFGKGADYAQQILNTDDPVPFTSELLYHCCTTDVTSLRPNEIFGHDWPLIYYTNELEKSIDNDHPLPLGIIPMLEQRAKGSTLIL